MARMNYKKQVEIAKEVISELSDEKDRFKRLYWNTIGKYNSLDEGYKYCEPETFEELWESDIHEYKCNNVWDIVKDKTILHKHKYVKFETWQHKIKITKDDFESYKTHLKIKKRVI